MIYDELNPFPAYTNPQPAEQAVEAEVTEKILKYNLTAPKSEKPVIICLIGGVLAGTILSGRVVTDKVFKAVESELEIDVKTLIEGVKLQHAQAFDLFAQPFVKEIRVTPVTPNNQIEQGRDNLLIISTIDNLGEPVKREVKGHFDNDKAIWVYPVNEKLTFDKAVYYSLLSEISVNVEVVY